jgi:hypothetical protein
VGRLVFWQIFLNAAENSGGRTELPAFGEKSCQNGNRAIGGQSLIQNNAVTAAVNRCATQNHCHTGFFRKLFSAAIHAVKRIGGSRRFHVNRGLGSGDALVLQNPDYDPAILSLALSGCVVRDLRAGAHCTRSEDIRQRNVSILFQKFKHVVGALHA